MTDNYAEAKRVLEGALSNPPERYPLADRVMLIQAAQVHATLALIDLLRERLPEQQEVQLVQTTEGAAEKAFLDRLAAGGGPK